MASLFLLLVVGQNEYTVGGKCDRSQSLPFANVKWTYTDLNTNPEHWAELSEHFVDCRSDSQSPIDLRRDEAVLRDRKRYLHMWAPEKARGLPYLVQSASGIEINLKGIEMSLVGSMLRDKQKLQKIVLKRPSEHTIDGVRYDLEKQFWYIRDDEDVTIPSEGHALCHSQVTVISHLYRNSTTHDPYLEQLRHYLTAFRDVSGLQHVVIPAIAPTEYPAGNVFSYDGSFPFPPCTQTVKWIVSETILPVTESQLGLMVHPNRTSTTHNNRPLQSRNGRLVERYSVFRSSQGSAFSELSVCNLRDASHPSCQNLTCANSTSTTYQGKGIMPPSGCGVHLNGALPELLKLRDVEVEGKRVASFKEDTNERLLRAVVMLSIVEVLLLVVCALCVASYMVCVRS